MIDQDLIAHVVALDTAAGNRVRLGNAHQGDPFPFVVIRRVGGFAPRTLNGRSLFERSQFAVHVLTQEYATAYPVAATIKGSLHGFVGTLGTTSVKSCRCIRFPTDESQIDGDKVIRWVAMEFLFMHLEV